MAKKEEHELIEKIQQEEEDAERTKLYEEEARAHQKALKLKGEVEEALQFAHDYLAPRGEDNVRHATFCSRFARACFPATMYRSRVADRVVWRCIVLFHHLSTRTNRRLQTVLLDELERTITLLAFQTPLESPLSSLMVVNGSRLGGFSLRAMLASSLLSPLACAC